MPIAYKFSNAFAAGIGLCPKDDHIRYCKNIYSVSPFRSLDQIRWTKRPCKLPGFKTHICYKRIGYRAALLSQPNFGKSTIGSASLFALRQNMWSRVVGKDIYHRDHRYQTDAHRTAFQLSFTTHYLLTPLPTFCSNGWFLHHHFSHQQGCLCHQGQRGRPRPRWGQTHRMSPYSSTDRLAVS